MNKQKEVILRFFPARLRTPWQSCNLNWDEIEEIRIRINKPLIVRSKDKEYVLSQNGEVSEEIDTQHTNTYVIYLEKDIEEIVRHLCKDSIYAYEEERKQGFLTMPGGHRIGITGELTLVDKQKYIAKYIRYINIRIAHEVRGIADGIMDWLVDEGRVWNTLIVSPPGVGKTTLLRDVVRNLSNGCGRIKGSTIGVIDERGEITGSYRGSASLDCGIRTDVITGGDKEQGTRILIRTFAPEIIVMDEIGTTKDAEVIDYAGVSGCSVIATVHGKGWDDLEKKKEISNLIFNRVFQRIIFIHRDEDGTRCIKICDEGGKYLCGEKLLQACLF